MTVWIVGRVGIAAIAAIITANTVEGARLDITAAVTVADL